MNQAYDNDMTADELLHLTNREGRHELVRGSLRTRKFADAIAGGIAAQIIGALLIAPYGRVYASAGFLIDRDPDTVRAPDAAFVRADRVVDTSGFFEGPPDVAFEVTSPGDTYSEIEEKTLDWLRAGVRAVVIVDPRTSSVRIHRTSGATNVTGAIEIDDVIPGWQLSLSEVFA